MPSPLIPREAAEVSWRGEVRYGLELARLVADREYLLPRRNANSPPVLLVPGFMTGDHSLLTLRDWLRRRGSRTAPAGIALNVDCSERAVRGIEVQLRRLAERTGRRVVVIGQSRGGELGRVVALRKPDLVGTLVMLGSPVLDPLSVGPAVMSAVRSLARLGDAGVPGVFSTECADGECCAAFRRDLRAPLPTAVRAVSIYS